MNVIPNVYERYMPLEDTHLQRAGKLLTVLMGVTLIIGLVIVVLLEASHERTETVTEDFPTSTQYLSWLEDESISNLRCTCSNDAVPLKSFALFAEGGTLKSEAHDFCSDFIAQDTAAGTQTLAEMLADDISLFNPDDFANTPTSPDQRLWTPGLLQWVQQMNFSLPPQWAAAGGEWTARPNPSSSSNWCSFNGQSVNAGSLSCGDFSMFQALTAAYNNARSLDPSSKAFATFNGAIGRTLPPESSHANCASMADGGADPGCSLFPFVSNARRLCRAALAGTTGVDRFFNTESISTPTALSENALQTIARGRFLQAWQQNVVGPIEALSQAIISDGTYRWDRVMPFDAKLEPSSSASAASSSQSSTSGGGKPIFVPAFFYSGHLFDGQAKQAGGGWTFKEQVTGGVWPTVPAGTLAERLLSQCADAHEVVGCQEPSIWESTGPTCKTHNFYNVRFAGHLPTTIASANQLGVNYPERIESVADFEQVTPTQVAGGAFNPYDSTFFPFPPPRASVFSGLSALGYPEFSLTCYSSNGNCCDDCYEFDVPALCGSAVVALARALQARTETITSSEQFLSLLQQLNATSRAPLPKSLLDVDYSAYIDECAPSRCTFQKTGPPGIIAILVTACAVLGGLHTAVNTFYGFFLSPVSNKFRGGAAPNPRVVSYEQARPQQPGVPAPNYDKPHEVRLEEQAAERAAAAIPYQRPAEA